MRLSCYPVSAQHCVWLPPQQHKWRGPVELIVDAGGRWGQWYARSQVIATLELNNPNRA